MIKKQQRYHHGKEAAQDAYNSYVVDIKECRQGCGQDGQYGELKGWWVEDEDGNQIFIKNRPLGPAANMFIVIFFSIAGVIALYFFAPGVLYAIFEWLRMMAWSL